MRGDGFQQSVYAADPRRPESRWAALVMAGLIGTSFVLGALGTHLMLTGRLQTREVSVRPIDIASVAASREVASKGTGKLDGADREPEPGASPSVLPSGSPLPALVSLSPRRDGAVLAVESLRLPASSLPHSSRAPLPAPENAEVLFDVPIGGNVILPVKTKNVAPVYPYVARTARIGGVVVLEAVLTAEGRIADLRVVDSAPLLDEATSWRIGAGTTSLPTGSSASSVTTRARRS